MSYNIYVPKGVKKSEVAQPFMFAPEYLDLRCAPPRILTCQRCAQHIVPDGEVCDLDEKEGNRCTRCSKMNHTCNVTPMEYNGRIERLYVLNEAFAQAVTRVASKKDSVLRKDLAYVAIATRAAQAQRSFCRALARHRDAAVKAGAPIHGTVKAPETEMDFMRLQTAHMARQADAMAALVVQVAALRTELLTNAPVKQELRTTPAGVAEKRRHLQALISQTPVHHRIGGVHPEAIQDVAVDTPTMRDDTAFTPSAPRTRQLDTSGVPTLDLTGVGPAESNTGADELPELSAIVSVPTQPQPTNSPAPSTPTPATSKRQRLSEKKQGKQPLRKTPPPKPTRRERKNAGKGGAAQENAGSSRSSAGQKRAASKSPDPVEQSPEYTPSVPSPPAGRDGDDDEYVDELDASQQAELAAMMAQYN